MDRVVRATVLSAVAVLGCGGEPRPIHSATPGPNAGVKPAPAPNPAAEEGPRAPEGGCPEGMVPIPAGTLRMGSVDGRGQDDERPQHKRELRAFCMDAREVTIAAYQACVKNAICDAPPREVQLLEPAKQEQHETRSKLCTAQLADNSELPVNCVGHDEASKYCAWKGRRLPSEAEWEWAATSGDDKLDYPWGANPPRDDVVCWQEKRPCTVGSKPAEAFGLFDLGGNVSEWTQSTYGAYPDPGESGTKLSVRGGNFLDSDPKAMRPKRRGAEEPLFRDVTLGFRCAKDL